VTEPEDAKPKMVKALRERRRTLRLPLKAGGPGFVRPGLSAEQMKVRPARSLRLGALQELQQRREKK
jgi:hypothetical protein